MGEKETWLPSGCTGNFQPSPPTPMHAALGLIHTSPLPSPPHSPVIYFPFPTCAGSPPPPRSLGIRHVLPPDPAEQPAAALSIHSVLCIIHAWRSSGTWPRGSEMNEIYRLQRVGDTRPTFLAPALCVDPSPQAVISWLEASLTSTKLAHLCKATKGAACTAGRGFPGS